MRERERLMKYSCIIQDIRVVRVCGGVLVLNAEQNMPTLKKKNNNLSNL